MQHLTMLLPSRLGCPLSLKTPNMGNTGLEEYKPTPIVSPWNNRFRTGVMSGDKQGLVTAIPLGGKIETSGNHRIR